MKAISKYDESELTTFLFRKMIDSHASLRLATTDTQTYLHLKKEMNECFSIFKEYLKTMMFKKGLKEVFGMDLNSERQV